MIDGGAAEGAPPPTGPRSVRTAGPRVVVMEAHRVEMPPKPPRELRHLLQQVNRHGIVIHEATEVRTVRTGLWRRLGPRGQGILVGILAAGLTTLGLNLADDPEGETAFDRADWLGVAASTVEFILQNMTDESGDLLHTWSPTDEGGEARVQGFLEDCVDAGVALAPGSSCGEDYDGWVRLCYTAAPPDRVVEAVDRVAQRLRGSGGPPADPRSL